MMRTLTEREELAISAADAIQEYHDVAPSAQQTATQWAEVFRGIGFFRCTQVFGTLNGESQMLRVVSFADIRPREATTIFRVCNPDRARHVSWTPSLGKALEYAPGGPKAYAIVHEDAHLYSLVIEPGQVLAVLNDFEWIIDPTGLEITDHGTITNHATQKRLGDLPDTTDKRALVALVGEDYLVNVIDRDEPYEIRDPLTPATRPEAGALTGRMASQTENTR